MKMSACACMIKQRQSVCVWTCMWQSVCWRMLSAKVKQCTKDESTQEDLSRSKQEKELFCMAKSGNDDDGNAGALPNKQRLERGTTSRIFLIIFKTCESYFFFLFHGWVSIYNFPFSYLSSNSIFHAWLQSFPPALYHWGSCLLGIAQYVLFHGCPPNKKKEKKRKRKKSTKLERPHSYALHYHRCTMRWVWHLWKSLPINL